MHIITLVIDHCSESHTAGNVYHQVNQVLSHWDLDRCQVKSLCTDDAGNMVIAVELLEKQHVLCMAHVTALCDSRTKRMWH